jgi:hypothetical protein
MLTLLAAASIVAASSVQAARHAAASSGVQRSPSCVSRQCWQLTTDT